jgi:hypothetical protein
MRNAQVSADKRLQLLQSQYTDEKFNDAMNNIASLMNQSDRPCIVSTYLEVVPSHLCLEYRR